MSQPTTYPIALDPALGIDPVDLATAWNNDADLAAHGTLTTNAETTKGFDEFGLAGAGLQVVTDLSIGLIGAYIYDLIVKRAFAAPVEKPPIFKREITLPNGKTVIVIAKEKE